MKEYKELKDREKEEIVKREWRRESKIMKWRRRKNRTAMKKKRKILLDTLGLR
jgi:hypothetical protein